MPCILPPVKWGRHRILTRAKAHKYIIMKSKGFKTLVYNIIMGILLVVEQQGAGFGLDVATVGYITVVGNFILRFFTTTKVGKSS